MLIFLGRGSTQYLQIRRFGGPRSDSRAQPIKMINSWARWACGRTSMLPSARPLAPELVSPPGELQVGRGYSALAEPTARLHISTALTVVPLG
jgi:hypothetical protein